LKVREEASKLYAIVRSYALRGKLLSYKGLTELAQSLNLDDFVNRLKVSSYKEALAVLEPPYTAPAIEKCLNTYLAILHISLARASGSKLLFAYYKRYRAMNIKAIIRALLMNKGFDEIKELINLDVEALVGRRDVIAKLLQARNLDECVQLLTGDEFYEELWILQRLLKTEPISDPQVIDVIIERGVVRDIATALFEEGGEPYLDLAGLDLDSYNIMAVLRGKTLGLSQQRLKELVVRPMYKLDETLIGKIIASTDAEEALRILRDTAYGAVIAKIPQDVRDLEFLERALREELLRRAMLTFTWKTLNEACLLAILLLKQEEIRIINGIALALQEGVPNKIVMDTLLEPLKRISY
jgi:vacuolar-type H+-ATPase subunit C/Vma6